MGVKVLFIDRDGTLIEEPDDFQVDAVEKIRLVNGVIPALLELGRHGYRFVMVSNQDGLGTDSFPQARFDTCHEHTLALFTSLAVVRRVVGPLERLSAAVREVGQGGKPEPLAEEGPEELASLALRSVSRLHVAPGG